MGCIRDSQRIAFKELICTEGNNAKKPIAVFSRQDMLKVPFTTFWTTRDISL